jgi:hypothetical protein
MGDVVSDVGSFRQDGSAHALNIAATPHAGQ